MPPGPFTASKAFVEQTDPRGSYLLRARVATPAHHEDGLGLCPRGRFHLSRCLRQPHGEEDQCRREEGASPTRDTSLHSFSPGVSSFFRCGYVASTSPSPDAFGASMRASGAKSMRDGSLHACNVDGSILGARRDRAWRPKRRDRASPALISLVVGECQGFSSSRRS